MPLRQPDAGLASLPLSSNNSATTLQFSFGERLPTAADLDQIHRLLDSPIVSA
jgi:hypothetical protein